MLTWMLLACTGATVATDTEVVGVAADAGPDFTLLDTDGVERSLRDYTGDVVLLDLSAFW